MQQGQEQQGVTEALPAHLQPIADRYGRDLFDAALRIAGMTSALDYLLGSSKKFPQLAQFHALIDAVTKGLADLNNELIAAKGWHLVDVVECASGRSGRRRRPAARASCGLMGRFTDEPLRRSRRVARGLW